MKNLISLTTILICFNLYALEFKSAGLTFKHKWIYEKGKSPIWGFDFIDQDKMIFTVKEGKVFIFNLKNKKVTPFKIDFPHLAVHGQGGLMDVKYHKEQLYFSYTYKKKDKYTTAFMHSNLNGKGKVFYIANAYENGGRHFGSRFTIKGNHLYAGIGDRGQRDKAQKKKFDHGKVLQFNLKNLDEVIQFSLGHRNPQGLTYFAPKDILMEGEFGPQGGDELNILEKEKNYGWPEITYGDEYFTGFDIGKEKQKGMEQPLKYWVPSISFSGIHFYTGDKLKVWKNNLFLACLATTHLHRIEFNEKMQPIKEERLLDDLNERIRMVKDAPNGLLYLSTDSGKIGVISKK